METFLCSPTPFLIATDRFRDLTDSPSFEENRSEFLFRMQSYYEAVRRTSLRAQANSDFDVAA
jgi:hypothetical protein